MKSMRLTLNRQRWVIQKLLVTWVATLHVTNSDKTINIVIFCRLQYLIVYCIKKETYTGDMHSFFKKLI